ncbi:MAG: cation:proton antiporter [Clostridia bacterium]|nr:cation:proton antiporter [Clostridia bacterium]
MFYEEFSKIFSEGGSSQVLFSLALALFMGLFLSRIVKPLKLPAVTGYLIAGVLIGPYCLGLLGVTGIFSSAEAMKGTSAIVQDVALGFIAFAIGTEFKLSALKKTGKQAMVVGCAQAIITMLVVDAALIALHFILGEDVLPLSVAITLGAIATATAPAATLMVVKQYKAKGPLTSLLLPVVALDDAVGLVCFAVSMGVARALEGGAASVGVVSLLVNPLLEVLLSLVLGAVMGVILTGVENLFKSNSKRLCLSITFVLLTVALAQMEFHLPGGVEIGFSNLLVCMMLGTLFCNICDSADELMEKTDKWTMPILILFFVFSGAELDLGIFKAPIVILIGAIYVLARAAGKYIGAGLSAKLTKCSPSIVKYLGITLFPQAGVALGMSAIAATLLTEGGSMVRNIVLFGVLIYELVGPMLTKIALTRAGDITPKKEDTPHQHHTLAEVFADEPDEDDDIQTP